jgi:hypothetical protein
MFPQRVFMGHERNEPRRRGRGCVERETTYGPNDLSISECFLGVNRCADGCVEFLFLLLANSNTPRRLFPLLDLEGNPIPLPESLVTND